MHILFVLLVGIWVACGLIGAEIGGRQGKWDHGFWIGFLLGPVGIAVLIVVDYARPDEDEESSDNRCGSCGADIADGAVICRRCQRWQNEQPRAQRRVKDVTHG